MEPQPGGSSSSSGGGGSSGGLFGSLAARGSELVGLLHDTINRALGALDTWWSRLLAGVGLLALLVTGVVNVLLVPAVNVHVLPVWEARAAAVLQREARAHCAFMHTCMRILHSIDRAPSSYSKQHPSLHGVAWVPAGHMAALTKPAVCGSTACGWMDAA